MDCSKCPLLSFVSRAEQLGEPIADQTVAAADGTLSCLITENKHISINQTNISDDTVPLSNRGPLNTPVIWHSATSAGHNHNKNINHNAFILNEL